MADVIQPPERLVVLRIHDTGGEIDHSKLINVAFRDVNLILLCFNIAFPGNLHTVCDTVGSYSTL
jgi:hypothetical protein